MIIYEYKFLGGAHGITLFKTFNFDLKNNKIVTLRDIFNQELFKTEYDHLKFISDYCRNDLENQQRKTGFDPYISWINQETDPLNKDNFSNYLLTNESLIIKFLSYQVAPGAAGDFSVLIPYKS